MDSAIPARYSSLVRSVCESGPGKGYFLFGCKTRLGVGTSGGKGHRISEFVAVGEELENLCASSAESAVAGDVFGEGWCRKRGQLKVNPQRSIKSLCPLERAPSFDLLTMKEVGDACNGAHRIESALCIPGGDTGVEDGVRQRKEHLGVIIDGVMVAA